MWSVDLAYVLLEAFRSGLVLVCAADRLN